MSVNELLTKVEEVLNHSTSRYRSLHAYFSKVHSHEAQLLELACTVQNSDPKRNNITRSMTQKQYQSLKTLPFFYLQISSQSPPMEMLLAVCAVLTHCQAPIPTTVTLNLSLTREVCMVCTNMVGMKETSTSF